MNLAFRPKLLWSRGQKVPCATYMCCSLWHGRVGYVARSLELLKCSACPNDVLWRSSLESGSK